METDVMKLILEFVSMIKSFTLEKWCSFLTHLKPGEVLHKGSLGKWDECFLVIHF